MIRFLCKTLIVRGLREQDREWESERTRKRLPDCISKWHHFRPAYSLEIMQFLREKFPLDLFFSPMNRYDELYKPFSQTSFLHHRTPSSLIAKSLFWCYRPSRPVLLGHPWSTEPGSETVVCLQLPANLPTFQFYQMFLLVWHGMIENND